MLIIMSASRKKSASILDGLKGTDKLVAQELVDLGFSEETARMAAEFEIYYPTTERNNEGQIIFQKSRISEDASDLRILQDKERIEGELPDTLQVGTIDPNYEFNQLPRKEQQFNTESDRRLQNWKDRGI